MAQFLRRKIFRRPDQPRRRVVCVLPPVVHIRLIDVLPQKKIRVLELFSGTGSVSRAAEKLGYEVVSLDISDQYHTPTIQTDIMTWDYKSQYRPGHFHIVWASPPCHTFSNINNMVFRGRPEERLRRIREEGLPLMNKALEIIEYLQPERYVIENPRGRMRDYMPAKYKRHTADYCQYSDWGYQKSTDFWTNNPSFAPRRCNRKTCPNVVNGKHRVAVMRKREDRARGCVEMTRGDRYRVPESLITDLIRID